MPQPITKNTLFYGDNLPILREYIADESVDLIYLDPPFNAGRNFNVLFKDDSGKDSDAQMTAFEDTWHWNDASLKTYEYLVTESATRISEVIRSFHEILGPGQLLAYLVMMTIRLIYLHRSLKRSGSLYLHCDPTASHYLKIILDGIFGATGYRNEITWQRTTAHNDARRKYADVSDIIFFYTKSDTYTFNVQYTPHTEDYLKEFYKYKDADGRQYTLDNITSPNPRPNLMYTWKGFSPPTNGWRYSQETMEKLYNEGKIVFSDTMRPRRKRYADEMQGVPISNVWIDIAPIQSKALERMGYPTQKPLALLERIIKTSSNVGDVVLDPFCGCGTAIAAAQNLGRRWIGIDITHLAIALQRNRFATMFPGVDFEVIGEPQDLGSAKQLAQDDRYQFQWWALSLIRARPLGGESGSKKGKKGSDKGIDGVISFIDDSTAKPKRALVQVKSGHVKSGDIRDLRGTVEREGAQIGIFITLEEPSRDMEQEAVSAGFYETQYEGRKIRRIQIISIAQLLSGKQIDVPRARPIASAAPKGTDPNALSDTPLL